MKRKLLIFLLAMLAICTCMFALTACGENEPPHAHVYDQQVVNETFKASDAACEVKATYYYSCSCGEKGVETFENGFVLGHDFSNYISDNNATYEKDGTKTAICSHQGCNKEHTITDVGTKLESSIEFTTLTVDGTDVYGKVSNATAKFTFYEEIKASGIATYVVDNDQDCTSPIISKTVDLIVGDNTFYVLEMIGNEVKLYTVTICRRSMYTVSFNSDGGTNVQSQVIEEDSVATEPTIIPERDGYTFESWNYSFDNPITEDTTITAEWTINSYDIVYELDGGMLDENINPVRYTIESNTFILSNPRKTNYGFLGWYSGNEKITAIETGSFGDINLVAKWEYALIVSNNKITGVTTTAKATCCNIEIPDNVTNIGNHAFDGCSLLTSVIISNETTNIGDYAFRHCKSLLSIGIPSGVTVVGYHAFQGCVSLASLTINEGVRKISSGAFANCDSLISVIIPKSITEIDAEAFYSCDNLVNLQFCDTTNWYAAPGKPYYSSVKIDVTNSSTNASRLKTTQYYWYKM